MAKDFPGLCPGDHQAVKNDLDRIKNELSDLKVRLYTAYGPPAAGKANAVLERLDRLAEYVDADHAENRTPGDKPAEKRKGVERRKYFRVLYPVSLRPVFVSFSKRYSVMDISERGFRFQLDENDHVPEWLNGRLLLRNNRVLELEGEVVRKLEDEIGVFLLTFIPYKIILEEQRHLINKAPFARMT